MVRAKTLGDLKSLGYETKTIKQEMRDNLVRKLKAGEVLFPGIIGYDDTVIPSLCNAILSFHDFILLGLRGQGKTKIIRSLPNFLDEYIPIIKGSEINDNPFLPVSKAAVDLVKEHGDEVEIEWLHRENRFGEKLATPDVTIADLIGDVDPIKAASKRLHYAHEGVIHFGIIPRSNRGIFAINELPDLQPRIQVGLFNIMQEKDIQIRGFPIRIPLDVVIVYTANPEDYTNRGSIITPLKDRIGSQIMTHYPRTIQEGMQITRQEARQEREAASIVKVPTFLREIIEQVAVEARQSEFVDPKSGVSVRMTVTSIENLISNAERRAILTGEQEIVPRVSDLYAALPAIAGKIELVYEGEQEGETNVTLALIGKAVRTVFSKYFRDPLTSMKKKEKTYAQVVNWFKNNHSVELDDKMTARAYFSELEKVSGLKNLVEQSMNGETAQGDAFRAVAMEFALDGLHQNSMLSKETAYASTSYSDMLNTMFSSLDDHEEDYG